MVESHVENNKKARYQFWEFKMEKPKVVKFVFKKAADYRLFPVNGAWGGITTRGDFILEFFVEHSTTPNFVIQEIIPGGKPGNEIKRDVGEIEEGISVTRELVGGVLLSLSTAKSIADFINEKCKKIEQKNDEGD